MLSNTTLIGATTQGTTFADIIINNVNSVAEGAIQGFAQFVHDPKALRDTISLFSKAAAPKKFADAIMLRRIEVQKLDDIWSFPLNTAATNTCPLPWTCVEANCRSQVQKVEFEFNIMRTVDFIGRNYIRLVLPAVDTTQVVDSTVGSTDNSLYMSNPDHVYLGAWHRDLVPRIISKVEFYPRSNAHKLFEYSGYDVFIHNILFGNKQKEMNDLMAGEDRFELCYDPYRVDGSAMGLASYKGVDVYKDYADPVGGKYSFAQTVARTEGQDGLIDYWQLDTTMDNEEFRNAYRRNVWYEAPIAKNYHARHSIHSRRMFHQKKELVIPLDILPFGHTLGASLPSAALSGECGFVKVTLYSDWFDRAFYLTKLSDIPPLHPIVNHKHYEASNKDPFGNTIPTEFEGWVNEASIGRFGDKKWTAAGGNNGTDGAEFTSPGNVILGDTKLLNNRENIIPMRLSTESSTGFITNGGIAALTQPTYGFKNTSGVVRQTTANTLSATSRNERLTDTTGRTQFIQKMSDVDKAYYNELKEEIGVKLMQSGYMTLPCVREFLSKLPNIYLTTEWDDKDRYINDQTFDINNDLYIQAICVWFIPTDSNGIESMRVYPCHMIDHELPICAGIEFANENSQGTSLFTWDLLNMLTPAQMGMNPLIENIGMISFTPRLYSDHFPYGYYDSNINGYIKARLVQGEGNENIGTAVNMRQGYFKVISIGVNGVASVNLNLFRLVF